MNCRSGAWTSGFEEQQLLRVRNHGRPARALERQLASGDFFWMLHTMDYAKRTSFSHPLIVLFATVYGSMANNHGILAAGTG